MAHEIGLKENQQSNAGDTYYTIVTDNATPTIIHSIPVKIGEAGLLEVRYNAVSPEDTPRQANRIRFQRFKRAADGTITLANLQTVYTNHDAGGSGIDFTTEAINGDILLKVTGAAALEIRHTMLVIKISGTIHESFTI